MVVHNILMIDFNLTGYFLFAFFFLFFIKKKKKKKKIKKDRKKIIKMEVRRLTRFNFWNEVYKEAIIYFWIYEVVWK